MKYKVVRSCVARKEEAQAILAKRDLSKEGFWRRRNEHDIDTKTGGGNRAQYRIEYEGITYTPDEFRLKFCPEWKLHHFLYYRKYVPAEIIVRYNGVCTPIHIPDVGYVYRDLKRATQQYTTKKANRNKARKDKKEIGSIVDRQLIL